MEKIAIIGLGYVGLPLAVAFAKKYPVFGFDINSKRIDNLKLAKDETLEVPEKALKEVLALKKDQPGLFLTCREPDIALADFYIITVPTPIDRHKQPDLGPLEQATKTVAQFLGAGNIVVYESTVYPGCTEEQCAPLLEEVSGLVFNRDFYCGYSPERINPGDKKHTVTRVKKVTSGSTEQAAFKIDELYRSVIGAGTFRAASIKVAEAAKVIENCQRDINIAFVNELAKIFTLLNIDTHEVLAAASSKWNFLPFKPGLVGGHCIGVDPYYLAQKAQSIGYNPEIILAGRRMNDNMGAFVAQEIVKLMIKKDIPVKNSQILILGFTFKENCPDTRNTRVIDIVNTLKEYGTQISVYDPWVDPVEVKKRYRIRLAARLDDHRFQAVILAVGHEVFKELDIKNLAAENSLIYDVKGFLPKKIVDARL